MPLIVDYVGAYPAGRPAPDLSLVPVNDDVEFYFALAFTTDSSHDGLFTPFWDQAITPEVVARLKQDNDTRKFLASLGGATFPWHEPADKQMWIDNAVASLGSLIETYSLDGIDVNYEGGIGESFVEAVGRVATGLKEQVGAVVSITPFNATWDIYQALYNEYGDSIDWINYQAYADGLDKQGYLDLFDRLAETTGYEKLVLGIASSTTSPRGLQPPEIYDILNDLQDRGVGGAMIWTLEDSVETNPPYAIESTVEGILVGGGSDG